MRQQSLGQEGGVPVEADLVIRAQAGDSHAFAELVSAYRRELQVHCYRILDSAQDAEDAVQETLLAAWRGLEGFEGRASVRTWLYQVATSRCLHALRSARPRPGGGLARALPRHPAGRARRPRARPGGPVRGQRSHLPRVRHGVAAATAAAACRADPA